MILIIQKWHNSKKKQKLNKLGSNSPVKNRDYILFYFIVYLFTTNWFKSFKQAEELCWPAAVTEAADAVGRLGSYILLLTAVFCSSDLWLASAVLERFRENTVHLFVYLFHRRLFSSLTWGACTETRSLLSPRRLETLSFCAVAKQ